MKLRINPYNHIFKAAGAVSGLIFLGAFGLVFGFLGGALIDQLTSGLRQKTRLKIFLSNPGSQQPADNGGMFCAAAGASVIWYFCRSEQARLEIASAALPLFFPEAPRHCAETLNEHKNTDYTSAAEYFGSEATTEQREALKKMVIFCSLEQLLARSASENSEAAKILTSAGYRTENSAKTPPDDTDYIILGLNRDATPEQIKKQYHLLAAQFHPDSGADLSPEQQNITEDAFKRIQAAYERLSGN